MFNGYSGKNDCPQNTVSRARKPLLQDPPPRLQKHWDQRVLPKSFSQDTSASSSATFEPSIPMNTKHLSYVQETNSNSLFNKKYKRRDLARQREAGTAAPRGRPRLKLAQELPIDVSKNVQEADSTTLNVPPPIVSTVVISEPRTSDTLNVAKTALMTQEKMRKMLKLAEASGSANSNRMRLQLQQRFKRPRTTSASIEDGANGALCGTVPHEPSSNSNPVLIDLNDSECSQQATASGLADSTTTKTAISALSPTDHTGSTSTMTSVQLAGGSQQDNLLAELGKVCVEEEALRKEFEQVEQVVERLKQEYAKCLQFKEEWNKKMAALAERRSQLLQRHAETPSLRTSTLAKCSVECLSSSGHQNTSSSSDVLQHQLVATTTTTIDRNKLLINPELIRTLGGHFSQQPPAPPKGTTLGIPHGIRAQNLMWDDSPPEMKPPTSS